MAERQPGAPFDEGPTLAARMRQHAGDATHLYGYLMRSMADDWEAGGVVREICAGWEQAPRGTVVQLRLLAGLFRIVLTGRADEIVPYYPCLGGSAPPEQAWSAVRPVLVGHVDELHTALDLAPQTNEVGRSQALLAGLFAAVRRTGLSSIRLLEPGASAGLNLLVDRYRFQGSGWAWGPAGSPLVLRNGFEGRLDPTAFEILERRGCDVSPVDVATPAGRLRLRSFVWPFHLERHARLQAALRVAAVAPPQVDAGTAADWLERQLATVPAESAAAGVVSADETSEPLTVVWHSITRQYWPVAEADRVEELVAGAAARSAVAHVSMEYPEMGGAQRAELRLAWSPQGGGSLARERLGTVGDHGFPVRLAV